MKTTTKHLTYLFAPAALILILGCKSKPAEVAPVPVSRNIFLGDWVGTNRNGATYRLTFTSSLQWESYIEESGAVIPQYKGTYVVDGASVRMTVKEKRDLNTFGWAPGGSNMPILTGTISGYTLKVSNILTDAELRIR